jgi:flagellar biosynthesis protein FlhG
MLEARATPKESSIENHTFAVGGGKGGTGKSLIAASIGICLANRGNDVLLVDADLGTANLH